MAISVDSVSVRSEPWLVDYTGLADGTDLTPPPLVDADGHTQSALIADTSVVTTHGETLRADIPSTVVVIAKDGEVVAVVAPGRVKPREEIRMIDDPTNNGPDGQDISVIDYGIDPVVSDEPTSFTTGHNGWADCPNGLSDSHSGAFDSLGLEHRYEEIETEHDGTFRHLFVTVPVPGEYLTDQSMDEVVVSEPLTITIT